jgi:hypothetical protein
MIFPTKAMNKLQLTAEFSTLEVDISMLCTYCAVHQMEQMNGTLNGTNNQSIQSMEERALKM